MSHIFITQIHFDTVYFDTKNINEKTDHSTQLNQLIKNAESNTVIYFTEGTYYFQNTIKLKSDIQIVGESIENVKFIFDLGGKNNLFNIHGRLEKGKDSIQNEIASKSAKIIGNFIDFKVSDLFFVYQSNPAVELSTWATKSLGQLMEVSKVYKDSILFKNEFGLVYSKESFPIIQKVHAIRNVVFKNFSIERKDATSFQTSHFDFDYSAYCSIENVKSHNANFAHVAMSHSYNVSISNSQFYDAFNHGNGGKAYGVCFQFNTSQSKVENCYFHKLRHAIILQSGANYNDINMNYISDSYWTDVKLPKDAAGDIVLHGNYPFNNMIYGNICNNIVVDRSHGLNGVDNVIMRNRTLNYGIFIQRKSATKIALYNNDIEKNGFLKGRIRCKNKDVEFYANRINGKMYKPKIFIEEQNCNEIVKNMKDFKIGYPCDFDKFYNETYNRFKE